MQVSGEFRQWHKITLDFQGPSVGEAASTFRDYRLDVTFTNAETGTEMTVPGFFAADGAAADSGASSGTVWRVHFNPPETGEWTWQASFRTGKDVAVSTSPSAGSPVGGIDGATGSFGIAASNKTGDDLRAKGVLQYDGDQYLSFAGDGSVFLKSGVGSPENFLGYSGFDNTPDSHDYAPHAGDWRSGDPSWDGGKGKGIIGAVNYLAEHDVNSAYMMLMNVAGDGRDVWPWSATDLDQVARHSTNLTTDAQSFDVSKLAQWEIVFEHMQKQGITLHLFLQENENDQLLNNGELGLERMLFIREMIARFGHHNGVIFNLGEENTNTEAQLTQHSAYLKALDAYDHPVALHTLPNQHYKYEWFEGTDTIDLLSFQTDSDTEVPDYDRYLGGAAAAGRPVAASIDEPGTPDTGLAAEGDSGWQTNHANLREVLWTSYAEGGSGAEWFFGGKTAGGTAGDRNTEDFSLRESAYGWAAAARRFFEDLPLAEMSDADGLTSGTNGIDQVLAKKGAVYAIYLPNGGSATLDLSGYAGKFTVSWYDVITGAYVAGSVSSVFGGGKVSLGQAPYARDEWAILVQAGDGVTLPPPPDPEPAPAPEDLSFDLAIAYDTGQLIDGDVADGEVLALDDLDDGRVTLLATPSAAIGSLRLNLVGIENHVENAAPYVLFGNSGNDFFPGTMLGVGVYQMVLTAYSGENGGGAVLGSQTISFSVAEEPEPAPPPSSGSEVVYRWNAGATLAAIDGGPAWAADAGAIVGSATLAASPIASSGTLDASVPGTTPTDVFAHYYWGDSKSAGMGLEFGDGTLANGLYAVRLYMGNGYAGTSAPGQRVFDVLVEDQLFLDNLDLSATLGHQVGGMFEWQGAVEDGTIDIDFDHVVENPLINGVEIIRLDAAAPQPAPGTFQAPFATDGASMAMNGVTLYGFGLDGKAAGLARLNGLVGVDDVGWANEVDYRNGASEAIGFDFESGAKGISLELSGLGSKDGAKEAALLTAYGADGKVLEEVEILSSFLEHAFAEPVRYAKLSSLDWQGGSSPTTDPDFSLVDVEAWLA